MAALSPFALYKFCAPDTPEAQAGMAIGLWGGIRALLIAVVCSLTVGKGTSFKNVFPEGSAKEAKKAVDDALSEASGKIGDAELYSTACKMEPRLWMCPWKSAFVDETAGHLKRVRLDMLLIKQALCGLDGKMEDMVELLGKVPEVADMRKDLADTMEDARKLAIGLLEHDYGKFLGLENIDTVEGLDQLDGFDEAVESLNKFVECKEVPETMEDDHGVRFSIVFIMLEYLIQHISAITQDGVKLS
jgi:hypothetical protein